AGMEISRSNNYNDAVTLMNNGSYQDANDKFTALGDYKDAASQAALCQQYLDYASAQSLMDSGDYQGALQAFNALGGFQDAASQATTCQNYLDYNAAEALLEAGNFLDAYTAFKPLSDIGFLDSSDKVDACNYGLADGLFKNGSLYDAYTAFIDLGSYKDSADRAAACIVPVTSSREAYHNPAYVSSACDLTITSHDNEDLYFLKIYCGNDLVSSIFILPGASVTIQLPANTYKIKASYGTNWFGDTDMFGDDGDYYTMTFDDQGTDTAALEANYTYTLDLSLDTGGNVGSRDEDRSNF
ncbi:MAG: hypothetical protein FWD72_06175, partial [Eggerthellaceae bacterium]|nr:hypothetical protein [Eggerthellaceae bacterium]